MWTEEITIPKWTPSTNSLDVCSWPNKKKMTKWPKSGLRKHQIWESFLEKYHLPFGLPDQWSLQWLCTWFTTWLLDSMEFSLMATEKVIGGNTFCPFWSFSLESTSWTLVRLRLSSSTKRPVCCHKSTYQFSARNRRPSGPSTRSEIFASTKEATTASK